MEQMIVYAIIQALQVAKAAWMSKLRQQGKTEEEIRTAWRNMWEMYKIEDPTALPKPM